MTDDDLLIPAVSYIRVSTRRQAEHLTSLDEQESGIQRAATPAGYRIVKRYLEAGKSGMNDRRPVLQQMIADACTKPPPFKAVFVYNFSRFFRDEFEFEGYRRRLERYGVKLISATQEVGEGPQARIFRSFLTTIDAVNSEINAEQVKVVMAANAAGGYWNGAAPPLGYKVVVAERRGKKDKKVLAVDEIAASEVELIFQLYLVGINGQNPLGLKKIVTWLADRGKMHRSQPYSVNLVHAILTRETYVGRHYYNRRNSRTGEIRPREEWIEVSVPAIITQERFDAVQARLASRSPAVSAPRTHDTPVLLSGRTRCGQSGCGGTMMLMTGKSGAYRYYTCSNRRLKAGTVCPGNSVPMQQVDDIVIDALEERLFQPSRLNDLLERVLDASNDAHAGRRKRLAVLRAEETDVQKAIRALYRMVEAGITEPDDPLLRERLQTLKLRQQSVAIDIHELDRQLGAKAGRVTPEKVEQFATLMRARLHDARTPLMRKRYVDAFIGEVEMTKERVVIRGPVRSLEQGLFNEDSPTGEVRSFIPKWRARQESNLRPQD